MMRTVFGKLASLAVVLAFAVMLFAPMRSGVEDALAAHVSAVSLQPGESVQVGYDLQTEYVQTVSYRTDDAAVAKVDQLGTITAVAPGRTKIRLTAQGGASAAVDVEVVGVPVTSFALNTHQVSMDKGDVSGLSCSFNRGAAAQKVIWQSGDPGVVTVDTAGRLTAVGAGETYVTATTASGLSDSCRVTVYVRGRAVEIIPSGLTVGVGSVFGLDVSYLPEDTTDTVDKWMSSDAQILSVDANGTARAISAGEAEVTVRTRDGLESTAKIVVEPAAKGFMLEPGKVTIERGDFCVIAPVFLRLDGQADESVSHHVVWSSSNPAVARVENGMVIGEASGEAVITAKADGYETRCNVTVVTTVQKVALNVTEKTLYKEEAEMPFQLKATLTPEDADDLTVTYTTDNPLVAKVSPTGLVTMTGGYGTAVITAQSASGATATCTVSVVVGQ